MVALTALFVGILISKIQVGLKDGWRKHDAGPFSLMIPPGMRYEPAQGIDSFVGEYKSATIEMGFDYGPYTNTLSDWPKSGRVEIATLHGQKIKLAIAPGSKASRPVSFGAYIPEPTNGPKPGYVALGFYADCRSADDIKTLRRMVNSVTFHSWTEKSMWRRFLDWLGL